MGYLVYCPTCNGKMSNNAACCPHCGETHFTQKRVTVARRRCLTCDCTGKVTRYQHAIRVCCKNGRIYYPAEFRKTGEVWDQSLDGGAGDWRNEGVWEELSYCRDAQSAVSRGDYRIESTYFSPAERQNLPFCPGGGPVNAELHYGMATVPCPVCKGKRISEIEKVVFEDIRKKVE